MGNYSDQPDYVTSASNYVHTTDLDQNLNQSAFYIGDSGNVAVIPANAPANFSGIVLFTGMPKGIFAPVIVDYIIGSNAFTGIEKNKTITPASPIAVAGSVEGEYILTLPISTGNVNNLNGSVKAKVTVNSSSQVTKIDTLEASTNASTLIVTGSANDSAEHRITIPENTLGGTHTQVTAITAEETQVAMVNKKSAANVLSTIVTYK
jgi:hypothetical protein